jgi:hypothetical protein
MVESDVPRDAFGHPWQALFYFDDESRPTRLVTDEDGRPLGYRNKPDGSPCAPPDSYVALADAVALAAGRALAEHPRRSYLPIGARSYGATGHCVRAAAR